MFFISQISRITQKIFAIITISDENKMIIYRGGVPNEKY
jgi:hypothetical protein